MQADYSAGIWAAQLLLQYCVAIVTGRVNVLVFCAFGRLYGALMAA
jgi:hypothetical protein